MFDVTDTANALRSIRRQIENDLDASQIDEIAIPSYLDGNWLSRKVAWGKLKVILRLLDCRRDDVLLDFGCGTGVLLALTSSRVRKVYASDLNTRVAQLMVHELGIPDVQFLSPEELCHLPSREVTKIVAANVLEHVPDVTVLAGLFANLLAPGGRLIVSGPTENSLYRLGRRIVGFSGDYHVRTIADVFSDILSSRRFGLKCCRSFPLVGPMCLYQIGSFALEPA